MLHQDRTNLKFQVVFRVVCGPLAELWHLNTPSLQWQRQLCVLHVFRSTVCSPESNLPSMNYQVCKFFDLTQPLKFSVLFSFLLPTYLCSVVAPVPSRPVGNHFSLSTKFPLSMLLTVNFSLHVMSDFPVICILVSSDFESSLFLLCVL